MGNSTQDKIILGARECFFKHGYKVSNMTLISRHAGFSRATLHKYFKNKDLVFRAVFERYQAQCQQECMQLASLDDDCWQNIQNVMAIWDKSAFEEVSDSRVLKELVYEVQQVAADVFDDARQNLEKLLENLLNEGLNRSQINLQTCQLTSSELAKIIVASLNGIRTNYPLEEIKKASQQTIDLYRLATQVIK